MTRLPIPTPMPEGPLCEAHCQLWPCPRCERFEKRERIFMGVVMALTSLAALAYILIGWK